EYPGHQAAVHPFAAYAKRQVVHIALYERLMAIEIGPRVAAAGIDVGPEAVIAAPLKVHPLAQSVGGSDGQAIKEAPVQLYLQAVVHRREADKVHGGVRSASE